MVDIVGIAFKALHRRNDIQRAVQLAEPIYKELQKQLPELMPLLTSLYTDFAPLLGIPLQQAPAYDVKWLQQ